jgi:hypothetical protein
MPKKSVAETSDQDDKFTYKEGDLEIIQPEDYEEKRARRKPREETNKTRSGDGETGQKTKE